MTVTEIKPSYIEGLSDVKVLNVTGPISSGILKQLRINLQESLRSRDRYLLLDLTGASSIGGAIVKELLAYKKKLCETGGNLIVACDNPSIWEKLRVINAKIFPKALLALRWISFELLGRSERVTVEFPPKLDYVPVVSVFYEDVSSCKGVDFKDAFRIRTIVDELCTNAVRYGAKESECLIKVEGTIINKKEMELVVTNWRDNNNSLEKLMKSVNQSIDIVKQNDQRRGRGIALVRMLSDTFEVEHEEENKTRARAIKILEKSNK